MSAARASALPMAARTRSAWSTAPLHPSQRSLHIRSARPDRTGAKLALVVRGGCRGPPPSRRATGAAGTAARGRAAAQRCSALPSDLPLPTELALLTLLVPPALGFVAWRTTIYGQLEYIKAAMLSNWVPKGGSVVLLSGGGTRDLYYMPKDTVKVTFLDKELKAGLLENAGIQAGVPVEVIDARPDELGSQADSSVDAVIGYGCLRAGGRRYLEEVARVLRPGRPFIFIDRVKAEGWQSVTQPLLGGGGLKPELSDLEGLFDAVDRFDDVTCDLAIIGDPHAVGVALLLGDSEDEDLEEKRILSRKNKRNKRKGTS